MTDAVTILTTCSFCGEQITVWLRIGAVMPSACPNRPDSVSVHINNVGRTDHRCESERHRHDLAMHPGAICSCKPWPGLVLSA